ncbi:hypothetical protein [Devosia sp.]|uniref:hypothetical protein n=1 Tax=Devosia sp. TaxID=1871048 RepID=UPI001B2326D4|nr:hypothetical protein [Devosia sp.]MBO9589084.1 hypothetical protein [Devosia sp.]
MSRWFRHYTGMMRDEKLVSAAVKSRQPVERVVWVWGAILESASEIDDAGRYDFDATEAAYFLRADEADICAVLDALANAGRVADGRVVKWGDRQYQSDKSSERQARYRERKRQAVAGSDGKQALGDVTPTSRDGKLTPPDTETDTDRKEEPIGSSKSRGTRLPSDFEPDLAWAVSAGLSLSVVEIEKASFRDYWISQPGAKGVKLDWDATWRNWVRRAIERQPKARGSPPGRQQQQRHDPFKSLAERLTNEPDRSRPSHDHHRDDAQGVPFLTIDHDRR